MHKIYVHFLYILSFILEDSYKIYIYLIITSHVILCVLYLSDYINLKKIKIGLNYVQKFI